jgi:hypothetical protein
MAARVPSVWAPDALRAPSFAMSAPPIAPAAAATPPHIYFILAHQNSVVALASIT